MKKTPNGTRGLVNGMMGRQEVTMQDNTTGGGEQQHRTMGPNDDDD